MSDEKTVYEKLSADFKWAWQNLEDGEDEAVAEYGEGYKDFLNRSKTERLCARSAVALAEAHGFKPLTDYQATGKLSAGDKVYVLHRNKSVMLFVMGRAPLADGMLIVGAHLDCPRLDLKPMPLYEDNNLAFFKTHYYGGIKKYQWLTIPLALYGSREIGRASCRERV